MKAWCKHKFGFVNVDDQFIYFSSTGNWSNMKDLGEFNEEKNGRSSSAERYKSISYLGVLGILIVWILWMIGLNSLSYASIIGLAWLCYSAYHYMIPGLTGEFKIPHTNITKVEINTSTAVLTFLDFNDVQNVQKISGLDKKGFKLFTEFSALIDSKNQ